MTATAVLTVSVILQFLAAALALRLVRLTERKAAWLLIAAAIVLMGVRRSITAFHLLSGDVAHPPDLSAELVALVISTLMVVGVGWIAPFFRSAHRAEEALRGTEQEARENYALLRGIIEGTPDPVFLKDRKGVYRVANTATARALGADSPDGIIGKDDAGLIPPEQARFLRENDRRIMEAGSPVEHEEPVGDRVYLTMKTPYRDEKGEVVGLVGVARDVTDRKEAQEALRKSEEKSRSIIENAPMGMHMYELGSDGILRFIGANPAADRILGVDNSQYLGKPIHEAFPEIGRTEIPEKFREIAEKGGYWQKENIEYRDERIAGAFENYNFQISQGRMVSLFLDITDRKRAEQELRAANRQLDAGNQQLKATEQQLRAANQQLRATEQQLRASNQQLHATEQQLKAANQQLRATEEQLRESEVRLRLALAAADMGTWRWVPAANEDTRDASFNRILGLDPVESTQPVENFVERVHPDDRPAVQKAIQTAARERKPYEAEFRIVRPDGEIRWLYDRGMGTYGEKGDMTYMTGAVVDITARKRAEEELARSEQFLASVIEQNPSSTWVSDSKGTLVRLNRACRELFGVTEAEVVGKYRILADNLVEAQGHMPLVRDVFQKGTVARFTLDYDARDVKHIDVKVGKRRILDVVVSPIRDAQGSVTNAIVQHRDVTDLKQAEHDLMASETRYRRLFESAKDGILILDAGTGRIVDANPFLTELTGYSHGEFLDRHLWEVSPFKDIAASKASFEELQARGYVRYEDLPLQTRDGRRIEVEFVSSVYLVDNQKVIQCNIRNITERKRVEEELRVKDRALESSINAIALTGLAGKLTYVNPAFLKMWGYRDRREVEGRSALEFWASPDEAAQVMAALQKTGQWSGEMKGANKDGVGFDVELTACMILGVDGGPTGLFAAFQDITARKKAAEALRRFERAVEASSDAIGFSTADGKHYYQNKAFDDLFGRIGDDPPATLYLDEAVGREVFETIMSGREWTGEVRMRGKAGNPLDIRLRAYPMKDKDGAIIGLVGVHADITKQRSVEAQLRQSQKLEAVGRLAGGIAHDFNNMLGAIIGYSEMILRNLRKEDPIFRDVEQVRGAADRAAALTRQLLAFSRKQVLEPRVININSVVTGIEKMLRRLIGEDIELSTALADGLWHVRADPGQIEQVLMNLAVNSRDAMPAGGRLTIETANVELDEDYARSHVAVKPGPHVMLAVSDTGCGMDEETRSRLFEPFFTTKEQGKGTGLGLSTVYGIVKQSGGNIWVYSEPGRGATFKVYLPKVEADTEAIPLRAPEGELRRGTETVLVVEDEPLLRRLVLRMLALSGYKTLEAANGGEALIACEKHAGRIDVVITDVVMPGMGGPELAERLRKVRPEVRVLFTSGYTDNAIVHHGVLDPGTPFLQKPFTVTSLVAKVREVLDAPAQETGKQR